MTYSQWEHKSTPCMLKVLSASSETLRTPSHTPWQGSGAGLASEDAMILEHLLAQINGKDEVAAVFKAYDTVRRPGGQRMIDSSRGTGRVFCERNYESGLDPNKMSASVPDRWSFIMG